MTQKDLKERLERHGASKVKTLSKKVDGGTQYTATFEMDGEPRSVGVLARNWGQAGGYILDAV